MQIEELRRAFLDFHSNMDQLQRYEQKQLNKRSTFRASVVLKEQKELLEKVAVVEEAELVFYAMPDKFSLLSAYVHHRISLHQYAVDHEVSYQGVRKQFDRELNHLQGVMYG